MRRICAEKNPTAGCTKIAAYSFSTEIGAIVEEVSTTHFNEDSVYKDNSIQNLSRNERKTIVDHWGRFQMK